MVVPVGTDGKIEIYNSSTGSAVDILADVSGYYTTTTTGQYYFPTGSDRILDTRSYNPATSNASPLTAGEKLTLPIPATAPAANATLVLNITAVAPTSNGDLAVYPGNQSTSTASALNWASGQTIANLNIVASAAGDGINLADQATSGTVDLIIDTDGYFANATPQGRHDVLTHQWPLTDGSGDLANDAAGENLLTFGNGETWTTSTVGAQPNASTVVDLNGADQYGQTVYSAIDTGDSYTVSAWANLDTTPTSDVAVVAESGDNASAFYLEYSATAKAWCVNYMTHDDQDATGYATIPCAATAPATGTWYHLIATYNAATHTAALYVNGTLADTATGIDGWSSSIGLTIGAAQYNQQMTDYFPGQISNVDTYNYALNATQAAQLYSQQN